MALKWADSLIRISKHEVETLRCFDRVILRRRPLFDMSRAAAYACSHI